MLIEWSNKVSRPVIAHPLWYRRTLYTAFSDCDQTQTLQKSAHSPPAILFTKPPYDIQAAATKEVGKVLAKAQNHAESLRESADQLFYRNQELQASNVPVHDVHTARQVLQTGAEATGAACLNISKPFNLWPHAVA